MSIMALVQFGRFHVFVFTLKYMSRAPTKVIAKEMLGVGAVVTFNFEQQHFSNVTVEWYIKSFYYFRLETFTQSLARMLTTSG